MGVFKEAIDEMLEKEMDIFGPMSFQQYLKNNGINNKRTAQFISVDSLEVLDPELRQNNIMVFRLGRYQGTSETAFVLIKSKNVKNFFFIDEELFGNQNTQTFIPTISMRDFFTYRIFPNSSESTLVNLGLASGVIGEALGLDKKEHLLAPTTGKSTFSFEVGFDSISGKRFLHDNGQVEIDCLLLGRRNNRDILFVIEAKKNSNHKSLSKHKVVYPILSIIDKLPNDMSVVPVYLKIQKGAEGIDYHCAEANEISRLSSKTYIEDIKIKKSSIFRLEL